MTNGEGGGLNLEDGDRLPWLEPADVADDGQVVSPAKIIGLVLIGLLLLGVIVGGGYWLKNRAPGDAGGEARLIPAQGGDYKIAANESAGKDFKGTGDTSYATSEGVDTDGKVDASRMPEAPLEGMSRGSIAKEDAPRVQTASAKPAAQVSAPVKDETKRPAAAAPAAGSAGGGALIQLGAYGSDAVAKDAWKKLSKRFDYLASLSSAVEKAEVGGATVYRLRAGAGSASNATTLCGRLKVAGENCIVVK
ncbi:SPOR domain-containing protein [Sphingobium sufflavum]|uniref:SPOR domain-containing protein n=1 Tax=Sphingobium sufflavum TaxID=1129547 RepID=UPI001F37580A|nr:SPOR domain-containing protein [Sphingobium sufflavum]MCE7796066.1 SPOR domain-containing protein [Sphingobium sufflavum]